MTSLQFLNFCLKRGWNPTHRQLYVAQKMMNLIESDVDIKHFFTLLGSGCSSLLEHLELFYKYAPVVELADTAVSEAVEQSVAGSTPVGRTYEYLFEYYTAFYGEAGHSVQGIQRLTQAHLTQRGREGWELVSDYIIPPSDNRHALTWKREK